MVQSGVLRSIFYRHYILAFFHYTNNASIATVASANGAFIVIGNSMTNPAKPDVGAEISQCLGEQSGPVLVLLHQMKHQTQCRFLSDARKLSHFVNRFFNKF